MEVYGYCHPINFVDRTGLTAETETKGEEKEEAESGESKTSGDKNKKISEKEKIKREEKLKKTQKGFTKYIENGTQYIKGASGYNRAEEIAKEELTKRGQGNHNNEGDAMRHAEWSRRMAEELCSIKAWSFGTAHEVD